MSVTNVAPTQSGFSVRMCIPASSSAIAGAAATPILVDNLAWREPLKNDSYPAESNRRTPTCR